MCRSKPTFTLSVELILLDFTWLSHQPYSSPLVRAPPLVCFKLLDLPPVSFESSASTISVNRTVNYGQGRYCVVRSCSTETLRQQLELFPLQCLLIEKNDRLPASLLAFGVFPLSAVVSDVRQCGNWRTCDGVCSGVRTLSARRGTAFLRDIGGSRVACLRFVLRLTCLTPSTSVSAVSHRADTTRKSPVASTTADKRRNTPATLACNAAAYTVSCTTSRQRASCRTRKSASRVTSSSVTVRHHSPHVTDVARPRSRLVSGSGLRRCMSECRLARTVHVCDRLARGQPSHPQHSLRHHHQTTGRAKPPPALAQCTVAPSVYWTRAARSRLARHICQVRVQLAAELNAERQHVQFVRQRAAFGARQNHRQRRRCVSACDKRSVNFTPLLSANSAGNIYEKSANVNETCDTSDVCAEKLTHWANLHALQHGKISVSRGVQTPCSVGNERCTDGKVCFSDHDDADDCDNNTHKVVSEDNVCSGRNDEGPVSWADGGCNFHARSSPITTAAMSSYTSCLKAIDNPVLTEESRSSPACGDAVEADKQECTGYSSCSFDSEVRSCDRCSATRSTSEGRSSHIKNSGDVLAGSASSMTQVEICRSGPMESSSSDEDDQVAVWSVVYEVAGKDVCSSSFSECRESASVLTSPYLLSLNINSFSSVSSGNVSGGGVSGGGVSGGSNSGGVSGGSNSGGVSGGSRSGGVSGGSSSGSVSGGSSSDQEQLVISSYSISTASSVDISARIARLLEASPIQATSVWRKNTTDGPTPLHQSPNTDSVSSYEPSSYMDQPSS